MLHCGAYSKIKLNSEHDMNDPVYKNNYTVHNIQYVDIEYTLL